MSEIIVKETRGKKPKWNFTEMKLGENRKFKNTTTSIILNCAKHYSKAKEFNWEFRCYTDGKNICLVRIK